MDVISQNFAEYAKKLWRIMGLMILSPSKIFISVKPKLREPIKELQGQHSVSWRNFKVALKAEYFLEDSQRLTKQTFIKWVQMKNKGLTSRELLREFEKKFDQLSTGEQQSLRSEKVELFVQAADSRLRKSLVQLLEDRAGELGLTSDEQNFFVQDHSSYSVILGQPYIVALRMETKVLDDGSAYARV
ncbi:hypothetical protein L7F22_053082 [Adiantum nelumboides]|nr:hypothetical protein [Adiantum nelumboides]